MLTEDCENIPTEVKTKSPGHVINAIGLSRCDIESTQTLEQHSPTHAVSPSKRIRHARGPNGEYCCSWPACSRTFLTSKKLSIHIRTMHKPRTLCIAGCGQIFGDKKPMLRHVRVYHRQFLPTLDAFKCSISECKREFTHPDNLKRHIEEVHTKQRWRRR